jgi:DNA-binding transcriptional LysR family regulator
MDRLAAIEAFVRVADSGSFSDAARRLNLSKSVVSRQVAALEADLGVRLLHRTTRSLTLTEAGRAFHDKATRILSDVDEAVTSVSRLQQAPRGRLRISAPTNFGIHHLVPAVPQFLDRYPEVELDLVLNDRFVDLVDEGFDVAVRVGRLADSSLVSRRLAPFRAEVCASPAYLAAHGAPASPDDLAGRACLTYSYLDPVDEWSFATADGKPWPVTVHGRLRVNNADALRVAALHGLGLAYLPTFLVGDDLEAGTLVAVLQDYMPRRQGRAIHAVYPHARHLSPKVRAFVDFLAERFAQSG